jgi:hypothetical protein
MSQRVIIAMGDPVESGAIQNILTAISDPGILSGFELAVSASNIIAINAGSALTDSGVLIIESEQRTQLFTLTVSPANYTLYYSYVPTNSFGGNPAVLTLQAGLINPSTFENGVILGWIKYPGLSQALNASMFISAPRFHLSQPVELLSDEYRTNYAPFSNQWTQFSTSGPAPAISESWNTNYAAPITTVSNAGSLLARSVYMLPFRVPHYGVGKVLIELETDTGASLLVQIVDSTGNILTPPEGGFFSNNLMESSILTVPYSAGLVPNSQAFIMLSFTIQPTFAVRIQSIGTSSYTEPF